MSTSRLIFPNLSWSEFLLVLSYLDLIDVYRSVGRLNRSGFLTFLREKSARTAKHCISSRCASVPSFLPKLSSHERVLLVSYPRSGNSFLRQVLESETGVITGSDSRTNRPLSTKLLSCGYAGEGVTDQAVWVVKSHYPERLGYIKFNVRRVVLLVRNPFDALESYFHMGMTNTHDKRLTQEGFNIVQSIWSDFFRNEAKVWVDFHEFWLARHGEIPLHFVKYEDMLHDREGTLTQLMDFLCSGSPPRSVVRNRRRQRSIELSAGHTFIPRYAPKQGGIGKSLSAMSDKDIEVIRDITAKYLHMFGYNVFRDDSGQYRVTNTTIDVNAVLDGGLSQKGMTGTSQGIMTINAQADIREASDKFGRKMTELRKSFTENDSKPLGTLS